MKVYNKKDIQKIIEDLNENKILIIPTDTQMGIVCKDKEKIYQIKNRDKSKKIIKFINSTNGYDFSEDFNLVAKAFWPGKITLIENDLSYRIPKNKVILKILSEVKELYSSSANISGEEPFKNSLMYKNKFDKKFEDEIIILKGKTSSSKPSTIYDVNNKKILRFGKITERDILKVFQKRK